jgi:hypothetical protein
MHLLEDRGHIRIEWGEQGRGHSSRYWMVLKPAPAQVSDDGKLTPETVLEDEKHTQASVLKPSPASVTPLKEESRERGRKSLAPPIFLGRGRKSARTTNPPSRNRPNAKRPRPSSTPPNSSNSGRHTRNAWPRRRPAKLSPPPASVLPLMC